jgi:hypothetical protein
MRATVAEVLKQYGDATFAFGKWHNTPAEETTAGGCSKTGPPVWVSSISMASLATAIEREGKPDDFDFSYPGSPIDVFARHPYDDGVLLGGIGVLRHRPADFDAVVSLCRVSDDDVPVGLPHVAVQPDRSS